jgi:hypothetical protein
LRCNSRLSGRDRDESSLPQPAQGGKGPGPSLAGGVVVVDQRSKPMVLSSKVPPQFRRGEWTSLISQDVAWASPAKLRKKPLSADACLQAWRPPKGVRLCSSGPLASAAVNPPRLASPLPRGFLLQAGGSRISSPIVARLGDRDRTEAREPEHLAPCPDSPTPRYLRPSPRGTKQAWHLCRTSRLLLLRLR